MKNAKERNPKWDKDELSRDLWHVKSDYNSYWEFELRATISLSLFSFVTRGALSVIYTFSNSGHLGLLPIACLRIKEWRCLSSSGCCFFSLTEHSDLGTIKWSYRLTDPNFSVLWNHQSLKWSNPVAKIIHKGPPLNIFHIRYKHRCILKIVHLSCYSPIHLDWGLQIGIHSPHSSCTHVLFALHKVL